MRWKMTLAGVAAAAFATYACSSSPSAPSGSGTLNLKITDSPFSDAKAVLVTFSEVTAHRSGEGEGGWSTLPFADTATSRTCDLKKLESAEDVLGIGALPAGHYTQLRLVVSSAAIYFDNASAGSACAASIPEPAGAKAALTIPSGEVKLNREFTVPEGGATTILVDFDGDRSIQQTGNGAYRMTPVIGIVSVD
jgi:hypothetical protein